MLDIIADGITLGAVYALVATGFSLIFRTMGLFNIAQGHLLALAPYVLYALMTDHSWSFWSAAVGAVALMGAIAAATHVLLLRRLLGREHWAAIMVTVGLVIVFESVMEILWGSNSFQLDTPWELRRVVIGGVETTNVGIASVMIAIVAIGTLAVTFQGTTFGARLRAAATNPRLAAVSGVNINLMFAVTWAIAGVLAAVAGIEYASVTVAGPALVGLGLRSFPAALVGGLDSLPGSAIGGLIVGITESWAVSQFGAEAADAAVFAVLIVTLTLRPHGVLGRAHAERM
jgi:branched-chain amino acid transport system permease protein